MIAYFDVVCSDGTHQPIGYRVRYYLNFLFGTMWYKIDEVTYYSLDAFKSATYKADGYKFSKNFPKNLETFVNTGEFQGLESV